MLTLTILAGLALLFVGGELLVRGAVLMALRLGVSALVVGLTVVGFGTSMPELVTCLQAALGGSPGIAIGNVVGSNIANVLLILGVAALICPIPVPFHTIIRDGGLMLGAALALAALAMTGTLGRLDGAMLILGLAIYLWLLWEQERQESPELSSLRDNAATLLEPGTVMAPPGRTGIAGEIALLGGGIALVVAGGHLLVSGSVQLAESLGVSDTLIGLTIVAVGTSLPELATSLVAALHRQSDIAYGNIVGSNVFNVLGIAGVTALTVPFDVPAHIVSFDIPVMIGVCAAMAVFAATGARLTRGEGALLLAGYGVYLIAIVPH